MYVKKIDWLDEVSKEAIVEVAEGIERLVCFSCPCLYKLNDMLREPLECLDTQDIVSCSTVGSDIKKLEKKFSYKLKGQLVKIFYDKEKMEKNIEKTTIKIQ